LTEGHPRVVAIGGGHGLAATLRAVRRYASHTTAIVSVADDGGSSGRLRQTLGIPAPGDARRCLVALAEDDALWAEAFEHRFTAPGLVGHAFGNLVIAGLAQVTGDFTAALDEAGRLVGAVGRVLPATAIPVSLHAETADGPIDGQVAIAGTPRITHVSLVPADAKPPPAALDALADADQVVLGPGSLFTSVLAAAVVPALRDALEVASASPICASSRARQRASTSPPTSTRSPGTASTSTSCSAIRVARAWESSVSSGLCARLPALTAWRTTPRSWLLPYGTSSPSLGVDTLKDGEERRH